MAPPFFAARALSCARNGEKCETIGHMSVIARESLSLAKWQRLLIRGYRLGFALLATIALVVQYADSSQISGFSAVNFFSYFTILSNILGAVVLLWAAFSYRRSEALDYVRGAAAAYLAVTGLVFALLLADESESLGMLYPWVDGIVHELMPLVVIFDWLLVPPIARLGLRRTWWWLAFPISYVAYSLLRGQLLIGIRTLF